MSKEEIIEFLNKELQKRKLFIEEIGYYYIDKIKKEKDVSLAYYGENKNKWLIENSCFEVLLDEDTLDTIAEEAKEQRNLYGACVGDEVYSLYDGKGKITNIRFFETYQLEVEFKNKNKIEYFRFDGKYDSSDDMPTLFFEKPEFEFPKKRFDLIGFLKENIEIAEEKNDKNFRFCYSHKTQKYSLIPEFGNIFEFACKYFKTKSNITTEDIEKVLNNNNLKFSDFKNALKELEWY